MSHSLMRRWQYVTHDSVSYYTGWGGGMDGGVGGGDGWSGDDGGAGGGDGWRGDGGGGWGS